MRFTPVTASDSSGDEFDEDAQKQLEHLNALLGTLKHYFGGLDKLFAPVHDPRNPNQSYYPLVELLFAGVLMFLCRLGSRRELNHQFRDSVRSQAKFEALFGVVGIPHGDSLNYTFKRLCPEEVQEVLCRMVEILIRKKVLYPWRLMDQYFMIAIDGTGVFTSHQRHCPHCLTRTLKDGTTLYYHPILEAKLVTSNGFSLSIMTEFIENSDPNAEKQDCELKAFYRLAERLKARFPRLPICLLLDGLFAGGPTFGLCRRYRWKYLITLRDTDLPSVNEEFDALCKLEPKNGTSLELGPERDIHQAYRWVNAISYQDSKGKEHLISVLQCVETKANTEDKRSTQKFKWITNFHLTPKQVIPLANEGGRLRWKIENEGFNVQKNGGFELEHAYSQDQNAGKIFYLLLQIAHFLFQLIEKGSLFRKAFPKGVGSLKNIAKRLLEAWRNLAVSADTLLRLGEGPFQIRVAFFDSS